MNGLPFDKKWGNESLPATTLLCKYQFTMLKIAKSIEQLNTEKRGKVLGNSECFHLRQSTDYSIVGGGPGFYKIETVIDGKARDLYISEIEYNHMVTGRSRGMVPYLDHLPH